VFLYLEKVGMAFRTSTENSDLPLILLGIKAARISYEWQNVTDHGVKMTTKKHNLIDQRLQDLNDDGVDRRRISEVPLRGPVQA
jgi:hypothetical protein